MGPHPVALRERVVRAVDNGAMAAEAAARLEVGEVSVKRWVRRRRERGSLEPNVRHGRPPLLDEQVIDAAMNGATFEAWVEQMLMPELPERAIVVMDNLSARKGARVRELNEAGGAEVRYLPPYSPDLNPIEQAGLRQAQTSTAPGAASDARGAVEGDRRVARALRSGRTRPLLRARRLQDQDDVRIL